MNEKKYRILQVHNRYQIPGGEDVVAKAERDLLEQHGHKVFVYWRDNSEIANYKGIKRLVIPFIAVFSIKSYMEIKQIIREEKIDIVHVHNTLMMVSPSVFYAAYHSNVPIVQTLHNFRMLCPAGSFFRNGRICEECMEGGLLPAIKHKCYRKSRVQSCVSALILATHRKFNSYRKAYYICLTEFDWEKISCINKKRMIINPNRVFIKPNFTNRVENRQDARSLGDYYLFVGRIEELKGIELVIRAFERIPEEYLVVAGTGPLLEKMEQYIEKKKIKNVYFTGYLDEKQLQERYSNAKALIVASQCYESFGMSVAEAYANGLPVIGGNIGNIGRTIVDGVTGLIFQYDSIESLVTTIQKYRTVNIDVMRNAAYNYYETFFSPEKNYQQLEQIYESIIVERS